MARRGIDESELKAIVQAEAEQALGYMASDLAEQREDAVKAYLGEPYGNEVEGRSQVVDTAAQETVEWIMPSLLRVFTAGESAVEFTATGPEDEPLAEQATAYCNWVWDRQNEGFANTYTWFKDALISKLGVVKIYYEQSEQWKRESYQGLDDASFAEIAGDADVEVLEHTEQADEAVGPDGLPISATSHDVVVKKRRTTGKICVKPVPPEEMLFSRDARDVQTARYIAHRRKMTVSDLIEMYPRKRKQIEGMSSDTGDMTDATTEALARDTVEDSDISMQTSAVNEAMRHLWVTESFIRVDVDGDGIAEMRRVVTAGDGHMVLESEEWDGPRPFATLSPIMMPHRLFGLSVVDLVQDLQKIRTSVLRQYLDALYLANNPRQEVDADRVEDPAELLSSKPGGIVRVKGAPGVAAIRPIGVPFVGAQALEGLQYLDQLRENRTGVSSRTQGLGADSLHDTASGEALMYTAAMMRVELIARVFAETGVKDAFKLIMANAAQYHDKSKAQTIRLKNQWVQIDPRSWEMEYDFTANVGLGAGQNDQQLLAMREILALQEKAVMAQGGASGPIVTAANIHAAAVQFAKLAGIKGPDRFFSDPAVTPMPPPAPDPRMIEMQAKMQLETQKLEQDKLRDKSKAELEAFIAMAQIELAERKTNAEIAKMQADAVLPDEGKPVSAPEQVSQMLELEGKALDVEARRADLNAKRRENQAQAKYGDDDEAIAAMARNFLSTFQGTVQ